MKGPLVDVKLYPLKRQPKRRPPVPRLRPPVGPAAILGRIRPVVVDPTTTPRVTGSNSRPDALGSAPCASCGRMVHNTESRWQRRWTFCSDACQRRHQSTYQAGIARVRRAEARGVSRPCEECGEHFEPTRADARFCSSACRQKAHRKRVTLAKCATRDRFESRNEKATAPASS